MGTVSIRDAPPRCVAGEAAVTVAMDATKRTLGQKSARCTGRSVMTGRSRAARGFVPHRLRVPFHLVDREPASLARSYALEVAAHASASRPR